MKRYLNAIPTGVTFNTCMNDVIMTPYLNYVIKILHILVNRPVRRTLMTESHVRNLCHNVFRKLTTHV